MGSCCNLDASKVYKLKVGDGMTRLLGLEQVFLDVKELNLTDK